MRRKEDKSRDLLPPQRPAGRLPGAEHVSGTQAAAGSTAGKQVSLPGLQCGETSGKSEASKMHSPSGGAEDGEGSGVEGRPLGAAFILKTRRPSARAHEGAAQAQGESEIPPSRPGPLSSKPVTITSVSQGSPPTKLYGAVLLGICIQKTKPWLVLFCFPAFHTLNC